MQELSGLHQIRSAILYGGEPIQQGSDSPVFPARMCQELLDSFIM